MKRKTFALLVSAMLCLPLWLHAQEMDDLLRYSQETPASTARSLSMGNATGAIGGDLGTLSNNPAGLGMYRSSDIGIAGGLGMQYTRTDYLGMRNATANFNASLNSLGMVLSFHASPEKQEGLLALNFGIAYNQLNNFSGRLSANAHNPTSSFSDRLAQVANQRGLLPNDLLAKDAYSRQNWYLVTGFGSYIFNDSLDASRRFVQFLSPLRGGETVYQRLRIESSGHLSELALSAGINVSNRLYVGSTLGIPFLSYRVVRRYQEENDSRVRRSTFQSLRFDDQMRETGTGVNLKVGLIASPTSFLRIGAAFHTPTFMSIHRKKLLEARAEYNETNGSKYTKSPEGEINYTLTTPFRARGSVAVLFQKYGLLSVDYSFDYYPFAHLDGDDGFDDVNQAARDRLQSTHNVNAGLELFAGPLAMRLGGGISTSPYKEQALASGEKQVAPWGFRYFATAGFGVSSSAVYVDVAYRFMRQSGNSRLYSFEHDRGQFWHYDYAHATFQHLFVVGIGVRF